MTYKLMDQIMNAKDFADVLNDYEYVFIDWYATWCRPCKAMVPFLNKLSEEEAYMKIFFGKIDIDDCEGIALKNGIKSMPTFHLYHRGRKVDEVLGANEEAVREMLNKVI